MDPGIFDYHENADDQDNIAHNLRDGVLQRPIQTAVHEESG
jgi:hypothetical protein